MSSGPVFFTADISERMSGSCIYLGEDEWENGRGRAPETSMVKLFMPDLQEALSVRHVDACFDGLLRGAGDVLNGVL